MTREEKDRVIQISHLLGKTTTEFIEEAIARAVFPYLSLNDGKQELKMIKGYYLRGASMYEKRLAEMEGRKIETVREKCTILEFIEREGKPYYKIVKDGSLMKVPCQYIIVAEGGV